MGLPFSSLSRSTVGLVPCPTVSHFGHAAEPLQRMHTHLLPSKPSTSTGCACRQRHALWHAALVHFAIVAHSKPAGKLRRLSMMPQQAQQQHDVRVVAATSSGAVRDFAPRTGVARSEDWAQLTEDGQALLACYPLAADGSAAQVSLTPCSLVLSALAFHAQAGSLP